METLVSSSNKEKSDIRNSVFCDITPCNLLHVRFLLGFDPDKASEVFLRNVGLFSEEYAVSYRRGKNSS
jgi:hypothetical protein